MKAPIIFAGVIPLILCCQLILNLRESYHHPLTVTTRQGGEISEWGSRLPEPHIGRGLDSMGLPKLSSKRLFAPNSGHSPIVYSDQ